MSEKEKIKARFPVDIDTALRRLSNDENVECLFEQNGVSHVATLPRGGLVAMLLEAAEHDAIEESGFVGQRSNFGMNLPMKHRVYGYGILYIGTKPEERVPDDVITAREEKLAEKLTHDLVAEWAAKQNFGQQNNTVQ